MDKKRRRAYRERQSFWIVTITIVVLFTLGAVLVTSRGGKGNSNKQAETIKDLSEEIMKSNSGDVNVYGTNTGTENSNVLVKDKYPQIKVLIQEYFDAKNTANVDKMKKIVDNLPKDTEDKLKMEKEFIETYSNIEVYTKTGLTDNAYVIYAYYEAKFVNVDTLAPGSVILYVVKDDETDTMYIHTYKSDSDVATYIDTLNNEEDVIEFNNTVNSKLEEACKKDKELKKLYKQLTGSE